MGQSSFGTIAWASGSTSAAFCQLRAFICRQMSCLPSRAGCIRTPAVSLPPEHHRAHWGQKHRRSYPLGLDASKREEERRRTASGGTREEQNGLFFRSFQGTVKVIGMNPYIAVVTRILCSKIYGLLVNQLSNSRWKHHLLPHRAKGACEAGMTSITQSLRRGARFCSAVSRDEPSVKTFHL